MSMIYSNLLETIDKKVEDFESVLDFSNTWMDMFTILADRIFNVNSDIDSIHLKLGMAVRNLRKENSSILVIRNILIGAGSFTLAVGISLIVLGTVLIPVTAGVSLIKVPIGITILLSGSGIVSKYGLLRIK
eukprot:gene9083-11128_t